MEHNGLYKTAIYCRLSQDDGIAGDSSSIQTQKRLLEKYANEQGFYINDFYVDDGYSGLNFNRPDFLRMLKDIDNGDVNLVLTKDLSRLGRDYIQTGYYTEVYFSEHNVRYIALNDGVDTNKSDNDIAPFKNILNDMYARDLSRKVKSAKRLRALDGQFISGQPPYGYNKDSANKNKLVIDEKAAEVVKDIFDMALSGLSPAKIAKALTERKILNPAAYKTNQGYKRFSYMFEGQQEERKTTWCYQTIQAILKDIVYIGDMENRKSEVLNYKNKRRVNVPKDKHIIVQNTHQPIIDRETFERVNAIISARYSQPKHRHDNIFRSILFCSQCGKKLTLAGRVRKREIKTYYRCMYHYRNPDKCKDSNFIYYNDLYDIVSKRLKKLSQACNKQQLYELVKDSFKSDKSNKRIREEKVKAEKRLKELLKILKKLYEDYVCDLLEVKNYYEFLEEYQSEQKALEKRIREITAELEKEEDIFDKLEKLKKVVSEIVEFKQLDANMLNRLIERIEISPAKTIDGQKRQQINIFYRFTGSEVVF